MPTMLTPGTIAALGNGRPVQVEKPVLQLLAFKNFTVARPNGVSTSERYRLFVSDGVNSCIFAILATPLNVHIINGELDRNAIFRMDNYVVHQPQRYQWRVLVIMGLTVLESGADVGCQIGSPIPIHLGGPTKQENQDISQPGSSIVAGAENVNPFILKMKMKAICPRSRSKCYNPYQQMPAWNWLSTKQKVMHSIDSLIPDLNRWTIKPSLSNLSSIRSWRNERGKGLADWRCLQQENTDCSAASDQPEYFTVKATIIFTKVDSMVKACPMADCKEEVANIGDGFYWCEKCSDCEPFVTFRWRLVLSINISDGLDTIWVTSFQETAEAILGTTSTELGILKQLNPDDFTKAVQKANLKEFIFKLQAKIENIQDENSLNVTVITVTPITNLDNKLKPTRELGAETSMQT